MKFILGLIKTTIKSELGHLVLHQPLMPLVHHNASNTLRESLLAALFVCVSGRLCAREVDPNISEPLRYSCAGHRAHKPAEG